MSRVYNSTVHLPITLTGGLRTRGLVDRLVSTIAAVTLSISTSSSDFLLKGKKRNKTKNTTHYHVSQLVTGSFILFSVLLLSWTVIVQMTDRERHCRRTIYHYNNFLVCRVQKSHHRCTCRTKNKGLNQLSQSRMQDLVGRYEGDVSGERCVNHYQRKANGMHWCVKNLINETTWANSTWIQSQTHKWSKETLDSDWQISRPPSSMPLAW